MHFCAIIPARYASVRFPAKALAELWGKPLIQNVYEAVVASAVFDDVIIATDNDIIYNKAKDFGANVFLTSIEHQSGSDRIAEVAMQLETDIVFNVQGDEPLIDRSSLLRLKAAFADENTQVASLMAEITEPAQVHDPNTVKVVCDIHGNALYFSRAPIPWQRDPHEEVKYYRHIGVYAYRKAALLRYVNLSPSSLERIEKLEQLRLLQNGIAIRMILTDYEGLGVDTPEDLKRIQAMEKAK